MTSFEEMVRAVMDEPTSIQARAELAALLEFRKVAGHRQVWIAAVRVAILRGQFFAALSLCRRYMSGKLQMELLGEIADRFGKERSTSGNGAPSFIKKWPEFPTDENGQAEFALRVGCDLSPVGYVAGNKLSDIPVMSQLDQLDFIELALMLERVEFEPGQAVFSEGDHGDSLYLLDAGELSIHQRSEEGVENELVRLQAPVMIGEMAFVAGVPRRATVRVLHGGSAWRLGRKGIDFLQKSQPELFAHMLEGLKRRTLAHILNTNQILKKLPDKSMLLEAFTLRVLRPEETLFVEGDEPPGLFFVLHGWVEIFKEERGERVCIATLCEGDTFGEFSLLTDMPTTATAWMKEGGVVLHLSLEEYKEVCHASPALEGKLNAWAERKQDEDSDESEFADQTIMTYRSEILKR